MAVLKKYNLAGQEVGEIAIDDELMKTSANSQMIKDYIVALRSNARQWSASTQNRAEVNHSGKKPHPQKGTGRARQGTLGAPQYKGGGRVHTPRPKFDQHIKINRKEKRAAIRHLIAEKIGANAFHVLQFEQMEKPKTRVLAEFLKKRGLSGKRVLFLGENLVEGKKENQEAQAPVSKFAVFAQSLSNIPRSEFALMPNVSGYDVLVNHEIVLMDSAIDQLKVVLGGAS
ncbi:MAG: 50S ribosomal protein L4 [Chlamydiales bacterium]|nr:50S ribosomal protein L4 [Chlamydiales bacterium]